MMVSYPLTAKSGPVAQRIRHLTTDQGIPGSNPGRVDFFFFFVINFMIIALSYLQL